MSKKNSYPPGRVATKEEMLALADIFAKEDTEDGLDARHVEECSGCKMRDRKIKNLANRIKKSKETERDLLRQIRELENWAGYR